jgi:AbrB family looped-hinge helix DNA binding protein
MDAGMRFSYSKEYLCSKGIAMSTATLTSKGQTTIPKEVRERLNLKPGDRLDFIFDEDGTLRVVPLNVRLDDLKSILPAPKRVLSNEELDEAIASGWSAQTELKAKQDP